jgi:hypothetical protein
MLHWKHYVATGFRLAEKAATVEHTPALSYKTSGVLRTADLKVEPTGSVQGSVRFLLQGQDALYWRQLAMENDEDEVKKRFNEWMAGYLPEGVRGEFDHFLGLDDYGVKLMANVRVSGNLGAATGKRFILPGMFFESKSRHPFVSVDKRSIPVDVHYAKVEEDDVTYRVPDGFVVESGPQMNDLNWPEHAAMSITSNPGSGSVTVTRTLSYNYTILSPNDYQQLHDFYMKVATADQQQLILARKAGTAGN